MKIKQLTSSFSKVCLLGIAFALTMLPSCKRELSPVTSNTAQVAEFAPTSGSFVNSYYVKSTNDPYLIPVGFTSSSNTDRTINFTVTSKTAVAGQQYVTPGSITIKAGQVLDTLRFKGIFAGYGTGRKDTVTIKFTGYSALNGQDSIRLVLQQYCDVIGTALTGNYAKTYDFQSPYTSASAYTTVLSNWTSTGATTATAKISNIGLSPDVGFGGGQVSTDPVVTGLTVNFDWTDPANFKVYIPAQTYINSTFSYGVSTITGNLGSGGLAGTFSSCDQTFTLTYKVTVSAGSFGTFVTSMAR